MTERVRSKLGFLVRHPRSIEVTAETSRITLNGPILSQKVDRLLDQVRKVKGVTGIENRLEIHREPADIPGLQGDPSRARSGERFEWMQAHWSPTARVGAGMVGASLALYGASRRGVPRAGAALLSVALLARASANLPMKPIVGAGAGRRAVEINKTVNIASPVEDVFAFWANYKTDPKTLIEEDLVRIKTFLERNKVPRDAQQSESEPKTSKPAPLLKSEQLQE